MSPPWNIAVVIVTTSMLGCSTAAPPASPPPPELVAARTPPTWNACRGAQDVWYEIPLVFRVPNNRSFGVLGDRIAKEFVCAGVVRLDSETLPPEQATKAVAEMKAVVEGRFGTVASKLEYPESSPRSFCVVLSNTTSFELRGGLQFRLQKAYAVLDGGDVVSATPSPLHDLHPVRPGRDPWPVPPDLASPTPDGQTAPTAQLAPPLARWLEPHEPLLACEDTKVYPMAP